MKSIESMSYREMERELREDPSTHYMVKDLLDLSKQKDCVDFYHNITIIAKYAEKRMNHYLNLSQGGGKKHEKNRP